MENNINRKVLPDFKKGFKQIKTLRNDGMMKFIRRGGRE